MCVDAHLHIGVQTYINGCMQKHADRCGCACVSTASFRCTLLASSLVVENLADFASEVPMHSDLLLRGIFASTPDKHSPTFLRHWPQYFEGFGIYDFGVRGFGWQTLGLEKHIRAKKACKFWHPGTPLPLRLLDQLRIGSGALRLGPNM